MPEIKFLVDLDIQGNVDLNDHELQNFKIQHLATDPSGVEGQIYYNTTSNIIKYYDGSAWVSLSSATGDITEVIGGNNIDVSGGDSGAATVNLDSATISAISANTAKTGITTAQANAITANTAKVGITTQQASDITANNAKVTNVSTNLSVTQSGTSLVVNSSDGTNASLPAADTDNWGVMTDEMFDAIQANTAKTGITAAQASAITANTAKETNVDTDLGVITNSTSLTITSSDGNNASLPAANTTNWGVMTDEMFDTLEAAAPKASPALTGTPTAPTAAANTNTTQIATTAYVQTEIGDLIGGAPGALDTLNEIAAAINDDANYAGTITSALAGKSPIAGSSSIVTVGTIGTGVWNGTAIDQAYLSGQSGTNTGDEVAASTTTAGIVERATNSEALAGTDTSRYVTPAHLAARTYEEKIGDGSLTSIAVTHNLGTRNVIVQMYDANTFETVYGEVVRNSNSQVTIGFNDAPATDEIAVLITRVG